jgi:PTS system mannose-specific IIA component
MSVGFVIVTHHGLGDQFVQVVEQIIQDGPTIHSVSVDPDQRVEVIRENIRAGLSAAEEGDGVLILTDMFGGTPSNVSLSFLDEHHVEVVTGINLPMLIKLASLREKKPLEELATFIMEYGRRNISVANQLLPDGDSK